MTDAASIKYALENDPLGESSQPESDYVDHIMPDKIKMNLEYAARANLWTDFRVVLATFARIAVKQGPQGQSGRD